MVLNKTRVNNLLQKVFSLEITNKYCYKDLKYCKFIGKRNKAKYVMKKRSFYRVTQQPLVFNIYTQIFYYWN